MQCDATANYVNYVNYYVDYYGMGHPHHSA